MTARIEEAIVSIPRDIGAHIPDRNQACDETAGHLLFAAGMSSYIFVAIQFEVDGIESLVQYAEYLTYWFPNEVAT